MRLKKVISAIIAFAVVMTMLTGCKSKEEPVETEPIVTEETTVTEAAPEIVFEGDEGDITADEAVDICLKGYNSMANNNIKEILKSTNINLYYYIAEGEWADNDKLIELWNSSKGEDALTYGGYTSLDDVRYMQATRLEPEEVAEYDDFAKRIINDYTITDGYRVNVTLANTTYNEDGTAITTTYDTDFIVVKGNGLWRLDVCVSSMKKLFGVFSGKAAAEEVVTENVSQPAITMPSETTTTITSETTAPVYVTDENGETITGENGEALTETSVTELMDGSETSVEGETVPSESAGDMTNGDITSGNIAGDMTSENIPAPADSEVTSEAVSVDSNANSDTVSDTSVSINEAETTAAES